MMAIPSHKLLIPLNRDNLHEWYMNNGIGFNLYSIAVRPEQICLLGSTSEIRRRIVLRTDSMNR